MKWTGFRSRTRTRNDTWEAAELPNVQVAHCGHPTANYPYYIIGLPTGRTFGRLAQAQAYAEAWGSGTCDHCDGPGVPGFHCDNCADGMVPAAKP